jgi:hypothetical protein
MERIPELNALRSNRFILYVSIFSTLFLAPNCYFVYYSLCAFGSPYIEIVSAGSSGITSAFIMIYTYRKNYFAAKFYAWFEALISCYYYIMTICTNDNISDWGLIPAAGFVLIFPASLYYVSREIEKPMIKEEESAPVPLQDQKTGIGETRIFSTIPDFEKQLKNSTDIAKESTIKDSTRELIEVLENKVKALELKNKDILFQADMYIQSLKEEAKNTPKEVFINTVVAEAPEPPAIIKNSIIEIKEPEETEKIKQANRPHFWYDEHKNKK